MRGLKNAVLAFSLVQLPAAAATGQIELQLMAGDLMDLTGVTHAGDGSGRLFLVSKVGTIQIWDGTQVLPTPFLDIQDRVIVDVEQGLLGLAFHPDYETNGRFFVHYTALPNGNTVLAEYSVCDDDPNCGDPGSETILFSAFQPFIVHNGGQLAFGPNDGFLYMAVGDGGSFLDAADNGQDLSDVLGNILRFDVDIPAPYIPASNPFVGVPGARDEIWSYGLRNPWRFSFDRETGDMFIGDVGENTVEEINFQPASSTGGENYGWRLMEGSECFNPPVDCDDGTLVLPVIDYLHFDGDFLGCAVMAGYVYRGVAYPELDGLFFFGDFCTGTIWSGVDEGGGVWTVDEQLDTTIAITSFGEDEEGELYLVGFSNLYAIVGVRSPVRCSLEMSQPVYDQGDDLIASVRIENTGTSVETIQVEIGVLHPPTAPLVLVNAGADASLTVDPGERLDFPQFDFGVIPLTAPADLYELGCRISDPVSGDLLVREQVPFRIE